MKKKETVYILATDDNGEPINKPFEGYTFTNTAHGITVEYSLIRDEKRWRVSENRTGMLLSISDQTRKEIEADDLEEKFPEPDRFIRYLKRINEMIDMRNEKTGSSYKHYDYPDILIKVNVYDD